MVSRGAVYWLELEVEGRRPVYVLTRDEAIPSLAGVVVALITSRVRGLSSEVPLGPEDGVPRACVISLDNLRTVPKAQLTQPITKLAPARIGEVCRALGVAVAC